MKAAHCTTKEVSLILRHEKRENGVVGYGTSENKAWFALKYAKQNNLSEVEFKNLPDSEKISFWNKGLV